MREALAYFSDREMGSSPPTGEQIDEAAWDGLRSLVMLAIDDGSFGERFPEYCPDGIGIIGVNDNKLWMSMHGDIPRLEEKPWLPSSAEVPETVYILDMVEFCWKHISHAWHQERHNYFKHNHLEFFPGLGPRKFREDVNRILSRNGLGYVLNEKGRVERIGPELLRTELTSARFQSGDPELDGMLEAARAKFLDYHHECVGKHCLSFGTPGNGLRQLVRGPIKQSKLRTYSILLLALRIPNSENGSRLTPVN